MGMLQKQPTPHNARLIACACGSYLLAGTLGAYIAAPYSSWPMTLLTLTASIGSMTVARRKHAPRRYPKIKHPSSRSADGKISFSVQ